MMESSSATIHKIQSHVLEAPSFSIVHETMSHIHS